MKSWIPIVGCLALSVMEPATLSANDEPTPAREEFIRVKATRTIHADLPDVSSPAGCERLYRSNWVRALLRPSERRAAAAACSRGGAVSGKVASR